MSDVELTELQTRIYDYVKEKETISKKNIAKGLDMQLRAVSSPIKSMLDSGVLVEDEYGDYTIAAGVREELNSGSLSVPSSSIGEPMGDEVITQPGDMQATSADVEDDEDNIYSEYWRKHPEELVTYYQEEGLDALKKHALQAALENTPGVGKKALNSALHWFDIDEDVRRDPTALMRALEDAGVKHTVVGRVVRETFLPEKQYTRYLRPDTDVIIDRGRPNQGRRRRTTVDMRQRYDDYGDEYEERYEVRPTRRGTSRRYSEEETPPWARHIISRLDALEMRGERHAGFRDREMRSNIVIEPVVDEYGNPVPDPNNPGQYLERRIVYDPEETIAQPVTPADNTEVEEMRAEIARMRETLSEHETERKISSAIDPLLNKISRLEQSEPTRKAGLSDEQYKLQTEKEMFQDISQSVEHTLATVLEPIVAGVQETQRMTALQNIIQLEKSDNAEPGTYLKYLSGTPSGGEITRERVGGTIDQIKKRTRGAM